MLYFYFPSTSYFTVYVIVLYKLTFTYLLTYPLTFLPKYVPTQSSLETSTIDLKLLHSVQYGLNLCSAILEV